MEVDVALGRDAQLEDAASIADVLADWCNACEAVLSSVDRHIQRANHNKQRAIRHQQGIEQEVIIYYLAYKVVCLLCFFKKKNIILDILHLFSKF